MKMRLLGACLAAGLAASGAALGADLPSRVEPALAPAAPLPSWAFQATLYGWATALDGDVGLRYRRPIGVNVGFDQILDHLEGVFMGAFQARNDTWMFLGDVVWSKLGANRTNRFGGQLDYEQTLGLLAGYVGYRVPIGSPDLDVRVLAGARAQRLSADFRHSGVIPALDLSASGSKEWVDPLVGLSATYAFDKHWYVNAIADIGGFGVGSRITSQGFLAVGYKWTETLSTSLGYRALYTDYEKSGFVYRTTLHGVFTGLSVHF
jgi:hypothetical protein